MNPDNFSLIQPLTFMRPKEFIRTIDEARGLAPEFKEFVMQRQDELIKIHQKGRPIAKSTLYQLAQPPLRDDGEPAVDDKRPEGREPTIRHGLLHSHRDFLAYRARKRFLTFGATNMIAPSPHPIGGLSYHHPNDLQNILSNPSLPGHVFVQPDPRRGTIPRPRDPSQKPRYFVVGIGGMTSKIDAVEVMTENTGSMAKDNRVVPFNYFPSAEPTDKERIEAARSRRGRFRLETAALKKAPTVVKQGSWEPDFDGTSLALNARAWMTVKRSRPNPYIPGTPKYVSMLDESPGQKQHKDPRQPSLTQNPAMISAASSHRRPLPKPNQTPEDKALLLSTLGGLVEKRF